MGDEIAKAFSEANKGIIAEIFNLRSNLDEVNEEIEDLLQVRTDLINSKAELAASKAALEKDNRN